MVARISSALILILAFAGSAFGQSTFGSVLGTILDPSGSAVGAAVIKIANKGTSAERSSITDQGGDYQFSNLEAGTYTLTVQAPGFQQATYTEIVLTARQTARIDARLQLATQSNTVSVSVASEPNINTDVSNIAETKTSRELVDLPIAITTRGTGSTSPMSTLTTQPGVQTDAAGGISVSGSKPSMLSMSIDGISSLGPRTAGPLIELFPSFYAIAEIRVSEVNNTAEFSGISDITTISKSGTNQFHGGAFENLQNTSLNARNPFSAIRPKQNMNDFGAYGGGPVLIPKLYNGRNRTFFFMSYENLILKQQSVLVQNVPSLALRSGDLSAYTKQIYNPGTGVPYPNNQIPASQISPLSAAALKYLYPLPNAGAPNAIVNNFIYNLATPVSSQQGDIRLDQVITSKQTAFARFTYKHRDVTVPPTGSFLLGGFSRPEIDFGLTVAYNYIFSPTLINEVRGGFNGNHLATAFNADPTLIANELGLTQVPRPLPNGNAVPNFTISGFQATGGTGSSTTQNNTRQILDNLTWTKGVHTFKFGGDYRRLNGNATNVYAAQRLGIYNFSGAVTSLGLNGQTASATNPAYIGNPFAAFLLGIPDNTQIDTVIEPDSHGYANVYGVFAQDDWKVTPRLTVNYGLRWEYHPMFQDALLNVTNFLPDYQSTVNGQVINGAAVIPNTASLKILNPAFTQSIYPTPILTAAQAGIPESLRYSQKTDFGPRIGFAWRPFANGRTVLRGGYGLFIEGPLGSLLGAAYAIHSADQGLFQQSIVNGKPTYTFPYPFPANIAQPGSQFFQQVQDLHYKDPKVHQWNVTAERDLGLGTAVRLSYNGSHGTDLGRQGNLGQLPENTVGYAASKASLKYPLWALVQGETNGGVSNYHAATVVFSKRFSKGLQFQSSYVYTRNLTDAQGYNPSAFASEAGGIVSNLNHPGIDYGNVAFSRRNRFLTTFLYQLPFGTNRTGIVPQVIGGWEVAGVLLFQSGPFLTVTAAGADPSGTGFPLLFNNGRADSVAGISPYATDQTPQHWLNSAAFAVPQNNIGRFGSSSVGSFQGPGTKAVSLSLMKSIKLREGVGMQFGAQAANLLNHVNYNPPNTVFNTSSFGVISATQSAEGAGPRAIQATARFTF